MATASQYGPFCDRRGVTKTARKLSAQMGCDTFVTATANGKYQAWSADFPGDRPLAGYTVGEEFKYVPPLPPARHPHYELIYLLERMDYELSNPSGDADESGLPGLVEHALALGLLGIVRAAE
jgi:hypothetical protein